jgi:hypothetical protein
MSDTADLTSDEAQAVVDDYQNGASTESEVPPPPEPDLSEVAGEDEDPEEVAEKKEKPRQIDQLVRLVESKAKLFHAAARSRCDFYADIHEGGVRQTHSIGSPALNRRMLRWYREGYGKALGQSVIEGANGMLRALAEDGPERDIGTRTALHAGKYYIDLCDESWGAIEVSADGWKIVPDPPVRFKRAGAMKPLCTPKRGGSIDLLRDFLTTKDNASFTMVVAWLLAALRPVGPYPVLVVNGEQGSAKSALALILASFVDPNAAPLRHANRDERELYIAAMNSWVLNFNNVSNIPGWFSDALCQLATGGGFTTRALYTDTEEVVFQSMRPIILNGITDFVERGDLADRSVFVHLTPIPNTDKKTMPEIFAGLAKVRPLIMGALLDTMVTGLGRMPSIELPSKPRMAEFAEWATACEDAFTLNEGDFLEVYSRNQAVAVAGVIDADPVALTIRDFAYEMGHKDVAYWEGTATELLGKLNAIVDEGTSKERSWPKTAKSLGRAVARLAPVLRQSGIPVDRAKRTGQSRTIVIKGVKRADDAE